MISDSKVVIINAGKNLIPLGKINTNSLHSIILSDYLKENYPNVKVFQSLDYTTDLLILMYFCAKTGNILLINTTEKLKRLSCTLVLPESYQDRLPQIQSMLSFFQIMK